MQTTIRFSVFEVDSRAGELRRQGIKVKLQEQPLQILEILLENPGAVVTREELQRRIWPSDTFVDFDHGLYNAIRRLREALGDSAETPQYVETLARRGYRFIGRAESASIATPKFNKVPGRPAPGESVARSGAGVFRRGNDGGTHYYPGQDWGVTSGFPHFHNVVQGSP